MAGSVRRQRCSASASTSTLHPARPIATRPAIAAQNRRTCLTRRPLAVSPAPPISLNSASSPASCPSGPADDLRYAAKTPHRHHLLHAVQLAPALGLDGAGAPVDLRRGAGRGRAPAILRRGLSHRV